MSILQAVQTRYAAMLEERREIAIGADLIPRARRDDARYAGVDLPARAHDRDPLEVGLRRVMPWRDLPADVRERVDRIASELIAAGPEEVGRYATDVRHAYGDVPNLSPIVEAAMYYAWALGIGHTHRGPA